MEETQGEFRATRNGAIEDQVPTIGSRRLNKDEKKSKAIEERKR